MAKAAVPTLEEEYESTFHNHHDDDVDSEEGEMGGGEYAANGGPSTSKQNGEAYRQTDRFGFLGGDQYTDPDSEQRLPIEVLRRRNRKSTRVNSRHITIFYSVFCLKKYSFRFSRFCSNLVWTNSHFRTYTLQH